MKPVASADQVVASFRARFGGEPEVVVWAPGRVNLLGAHIDYNEGWVMPAAIDRGIWLAARAVRDRTVRLESVNLEQSAMFDLDQLEPPPTTDRRTSTWVDYPRGVAWVLGHDDHQLPGIDVSFGGNLPVASGVSSSAAVEMAFLLAWEELGGLEIDGPHRPAIGRRVENDYLGVQSGIMDQYASLYGRRDHLLLIDCRSLEHEPIALASELVLLVVDSGVRRQLVGGQLNDRRSECEAAVATLRRAQKKDPKSEHHQAISALRDVSLEQLQRYGAELSTTVRSRALHVVQECARVHDGVNCLRRGDLRGFGELVVASHVSSRDLYEVSIPELDLLAAAAWEHPDCYGARLTGAGFGGCVTALVEAAALDSVAEVVGEAFQAEFGRKPVWFGSPTGDGARIVSSR